MLVGARREVFPKVIVDDPDPVLPDDSRTEPVFFLRRSGQTSRIADAGAELGAPMQRRAGAMRRSCRD